MPVKLVVWRRFSGFFSLDFRFVNVVISDLVCDCMNTTHVCVCVYLILSISLCEHVMGWWEGEGALSLLRGNGCDSFFRPRPARALEPFIVCV